MKKSKKSFKQEDLNNIKIKIRSIRDEGLKILSYGNALLSSVSNMEWRIECKDLDYGAFETLENESDYCIELIKELSEHINE
ncbi:MAG: hypothetical protein ACRCSZ_02265 [Lactococcus lactis]